MSCKSRCVSVQVLMVKNVRNVVGADFRSNRMAWKSRRVKTQALLKMTFIELNCYKV